MVRRFKETDMEEVISWFHSRKIDVSPEYLPPTGFIEPGIACGFLYKTDANFCIFECFISAPNTAGYVRDETLRNIVTEMIREAKELGFKQAFGFATSKSMIAHGYEQGFRYVEECTTIVKDL